MKETKYLTTLEKANLHDTMEPLLTSMYEEFKDLSKKKPEATISKNKILIVNRILNKIRIILNDQETIEFLDLLNEDDMPQISDVVIMLSQYVAAMSAFKTKHHGWDGTRHKWFVKIK